MPPDPGTAATTLRKRRWRRVFLRGGLPLALGVASWCTFGPNDPIEVSPATTRLTTPLLPDGTPDYRRALLEGLREGVTPENNGAIPLLAALWPHDGERPMSLEQAERIASNLGVEEPARDSAFTSLRSQAMRERIGEFLESRGILPVHQLGPMGSEPDHSQPSRADVESVIVECAPIDRPWSAEQIPFLATWVDENRGAYALLHESARRSRWNIASSELVHGGPVGLGQSGVTIQMLRGGMRLLVMRCNYYRGEGLTRLAAEDAVAVLGLASHALRSPFNTARYTGILIERIGHGLVVDVAHEAGEDRDVLECLRRGVHAMMPSVSLAASMDIGERYGAIETVIAARNGKLSTIAEQAESYYRELGVVEADEDASGKRYHWHFITPGVHAMAETTRIDWNVVLRGVNTEFDRFLAAMKLTSDERQVALSSIEAEIADRFDGHWSLRTARQTLTPAGRGRLVAEAWAATHLAGLSMFSAEADTLALERRLLDVDLALRLYHADNGAYPESIEELGADALLVPFDSIEDGVQLIYIKRGDGFSVSLGGVGQAEVLTDAVEDLEAPEPWPWEPGGWLRDPRKGGGYGFSGGYGGETREEELAEPGEVQDVEQSGFDAKPAANGQAATRSGESLPATTSEGAFRDPVRNQ